MTRRFTIVKCSINYSTLKRSFAPRILTARIAGSWKHHNFSGSKRTFSNEASCIGTFERPFLARPKSISTTQASPWKCDMQQDFCNLTSDETFHPISSSHYETLISISKTRSYSRLCDVQQNSKVQIAIHSQLLCFTLQYHTWLSKENGGRKRISSS